MTLNWVISAFLLISIAEGMREIQFFRISHSVLHRNWRRNKMRKRINAFGAVFIAVLGWIATQNWAVFFLYLGFRWVMIDGIMNMSRNLNPFYVGEVADMDRAQRRLSLWTGIPAWVLNAFLKISYIATNLILL